MAKLKYPNVVANTTSAPVILGSSGNYTISVNGGGGGGSGIPTYTSTGSYTTATEIKSNAIHVNGDAVFKGNITWQDRDMREWFESVESRLALLKPNPDLESEWSELAELRRRYVELEKDIIAKQQLFDILKKT